jgi:hypothetical protein
MQNRVELTATVPNGQSLSGSIALDRNWLIAMALPAGWTAASITFRGSRDGGTTWLDLYSDTGEITVSSAAAGRGIVLPPTLLHGWPLIRLRSGTSASPVAQGADRAIVLTVRQFQ